MSGELLSVRLPRRTVPICVREPIGLARPRRTASTPAIMVVATAPSPTTITPSLPLRGFYFRAFPGAPCAAQYSCFFLTFRGLPRIKTRSADEFWGRNSVRPRRELLFFDAPSVCAVDMRPDEPDDGGDERDFNDEVKAMEGLLKARIGVPASHRASCQHKPARSTRAMSR